MRVIRIKKLRKLALIGFLFAFCVIILFVFLNTHTSNKFILELKNIIGTDIKILYLYDNQNYNELFEKSLESYDIDYYSFNTSYINNKKEKKLKRFANSNYINNIVLIYKNGKIVDAIIKNNDLGKLREFLIKNKLITEYYKESEDIFFKLEELLNSDLSLVYIPYIKSDSDLENEEMLKEICKTYNIDYKTLDAYKLGYFQKNKLNNILNISSVEDHIVILIKDSRIFESIRGEYNSDYYIAAINKALTTNIENNMININIKEFENIINDDEVNIVLIGNEDSKDIAKVKDTLNGLISKYNIEIRYLDISNKDEIDKIEGMLKKMGYAGNISLPLTLILGKNEVLDYSIGLSNENYYIDIFRENGIIKKEAEI